MFLSLLGLTALACRFSVGGPKAPGDPIPVSEQSAQELENVWQSGLEGGAGGQVQITITEEQLTSFVALKLAAEEEPLIRDPQIYLRDTKVQIYGTAQSGYFSAAALITLEVSVNEAGQPAFTITEANFGPLPVPDSLLSKLSDSINSAFDDQFAGLKITSLTIADGQMILVGEAS